MKKPSSVLFMCSENSIRSPIAQGIMSEFMRHDIYSDSAGVIKGEINGFAIAIMEEIGIDISGHRPKSFAELDDTSFDLIIAFSKEAFDLAKDFAKTNATEVEFVPIPDISHIEGNRDLIMEEFRKIRNLIYNFIATRFDWANKDNGAKNLNYLSAT